MMLKVLFLLACFCAGWGLVDIIHTVFKIISARRSK